eukprot:scaffold93914_cov41-Phaeocystis_antarctica.AAC.1
MRQIGTAIHYLHSQVSSSGRKVRVASARDTLPCLRSNSAPPTLHLPALAGRVPPRPQAGERAPLIC